jgi:hypothetical protein
VSVRACAVPGPTSPGRLAADYGTDTSSAVCWDNVDLLP